MEKKYHTVLVKAEGYDSACRHALDFLKKTQLVNYDFIEVSSKKSYGATESEFWVGLEKSLDGNRHILQELVGELKESGFNSVEELVELEQGYQSKLLHIIVHLLDGFIGIDSAFYNLPEDSHRISDAMRQAINSEPSCYWLLHIDTAFESASSASLIHT